VIGQEETPFFPTACICSIPSSLPLPRSCSARPTALRSFHPIPSPLSLVPPTTRSVLTNFCDRFLACISCLVPYNCHLPSPPPSPCPPTRVAHATPTPGPPPRNVAHLLPPQSNATAYCPSTHGRPRAFRISTRRARLVSCAVSSMS